MDIEAVKLLAEICILPIIGFLSTLTVTIVGGWVNHYFAKSLEQYKQRIEDEPLESKPQPKKSIQKSENESWEDDWTWLGKVLLRGMVTFFSLCVFLIITVILFLWVRPFGVTFILNRINELQQVSSIQRMIYELSSFIPLVVIANLYVLLMAILGGFFATAIVNAVIDTFFWIFDIDL